MEKISSTNGKNLIIREAKKEDAKAMIGTENNGR